MRHNFYFFISMHIFNLIPICQAMDRELYQITELNALENPRFAQYIDKDHVMIGNSQEHVLVNLLTQKLEESINYRTYSRLHPTQPFLYCPQRQDNKILIYNSADIPRLVKIIKLPQKNIIHSCKYNLNQSVLIALCKENNKEEDEQKIFIIDPNRDPYDYPCISYEDNEKIKQIIIHPNNKVLAVSSKIPYTKGSVHYYVGVKYWDIKTQQLIDMSNALSKDCHDLCFSPDGTQILITLDDECIIIPVLFGMREKIHFMYWILKNYQCNQPELVQDIVGHILSIVWDLFKYK